MQVRTLQGSTKHDCIVSSEPDIKQELKRRLKSCRSRSQDQNLQDGKSNRPCVCSSKDNSNNGSIVSNFCLHMHACRKSLGFGHMAESIGFTKTSGGEEVSIIKGAFMAALSACLFALQ